MAFKLKCVVEANLIRVNKHCISHYFNCNSHLKQLYISSKTECFTHKGGWGVCGHLTSIKAFKDRAGLVYRYITYGYNVI